MHAKYAIPWLNLSKNQSTARMSEIRSGGTPIAVMTIIKVTRPACGIPAAPTEAIVAVMLEIENDESKEKNVEL